MDELAQRRDVEKSELIQVLAAVVMGRVTHGVSPMRHRAWICEECKSWHRSEYGGPASIHHEKGCTVGPAMLALLRYQYFKGKPMGVPTPGAQEEGKP